MVGSYKLCKFQKQPPELFYVKSYSYKFRNIHSKTPLLKSLFLIKLQAFMPVALLKKNPTQVFYNIAEFLRTPILKDISNQLYLKFAAY